MAKDPVLQREMFNPRDRSARGSGITSMVDDGSSAEMTREERMQVAQEMLAQAKMRQNPEYYFNTLAQGDRPAMTRPVASSAPPPAMQPMPAMQQMAQMQAAGVRPVGMADGGIVRIGFSEGGLNEGEEDNLSQEPDSMSPEDEELYKEGLARAQGPRGILELLGLEEPLYTGMSEDEIVAAEKERGFLDSTLGEAAMTAIPLGGVGRGLAKTGKGLFSLGRKLFPKVRPVKPSIGAPSAGAPSAGAPSAGAPSAGTSTVPNVSLKTPTPSNVPKVPPKQLTVAQKAAEARKAKMQTIRDAFAGKTPKPPVAKPKPPVVQPPPISGPIRTAIQTLIPGYFMNENLEQVDRVLDRQLDKGAQGVQPGLSAPYPPKKPVVETPKEAPPTVDRKQTALEAIKAEREAQKDQNFNMALMQAGLAMMAGKSPNALQNIAEGGISGLATYGDLEKSDRASALDERKMAAYEDSLERKAEYQTSQTARAMAVAKQRGEIEAEKAYDKWVQNEGATFSPEEKMAYRKSLQDRFTNVIFNEAMLGVSSNPLDIEVE